MKLDILSFIKQEKIKSLGKVVITINDIREKEFSNLPLTNSEKLALCNYDRLRIEELNKQENEVDFHECYIRYRILANFAPFESFLKVS